MSVYLDLSIILHILLMIFSLSFVNVVDVSRLKTKGLIKFIIFEIPLVLTLYLNFYLALLLVLGETIVLFILFFKKKFFFPLIEYLFSYYYIGFMMTLISPHVTFINLSLVFTDLKGLVSMITIPISFLILRIVSYLVDKMYRLGNYSLNVIVNFNGRHIKAKGYYDTGNSLKFKGLPVVFFKRSDFPFGLPDKYETIEYQTVNGFNLTKIYLASVIINEKKESLVYLAFVGSENDFNGCECLLNVYLGV